MITCRAVVTQALRLSGVIGISATPTGAEADLGLDLLQSIYKSMLNSGAFGVLSDVYMTEVLAAYQGTFLRMAVELGLTLRVVSNIEADVTQYVALERQRIRHDNSVEIVVPTTYAYDGGVGIDRAPYDLSVVETYNTDSQAHSAVVWDRNRWIKLTGLTLNSEAPLAERDTAGLAARLAVDMAPSFGVDPTAAVISMARRFNGSIIGKLATDQAPRSAEYF